MRFRCWGRLWFDWGGLGELDPDGGESGGGAEEIKIGSYCS